jgi:hypothetical protein
MLAKLACVDASEQGIVYWCLLDIERGIPQQPESVRRRVMVRARATARWYHSRAATQGWHRRLWWHTKRRALAIAAAGLTIGVMCIALGLSAKRPPPKVEAASVVGTAAPAPTTVGALSHSPSNNARNVDGFWKPFPRTALSWHKGDYSNPQ